MFKIIKTFLRSGYDPNSKIAFQPHSYPTTYKCSPLHVAPIDLINLLLKYRADVNELDMNGHTPLDIAIGRDDALVSSLIWLEHSDRVILLTECGGRITAGVKDALPQRLEMLLPLAKNAPLPAEPLPSPSSNVRWVGNWGKASTSASRRGGEGGEGTGRTPLLR